MHLLALEKGIATHSSIFAWRIPWTEEPGRLLPLESQGVRHNQVMNTFSLSLFVHLLGMVLSWTADAVSNSHISHSFSVSWLHQPLINHWNSAFQSLLSACICSKACHAQQISGLKYQSGTGVWVTSFHFEQVIEKQSLPGQKRNERKCLCHISLFQRQFYYHLFFLSLCLQNNYIFYFAPNLLTQGKDKRNKTDFIKMLTTV